MKNSKLAIRLLRFFLPSEDADYLAGDFEELSSNISEDRGRLFAWFWLWGQVLFNIPGFAVLKLKWGLEIIGNNFRSSFRNIKKNSAFSLINITGLAVGMAAVMTIFIYVYSEISIDKWHEDADSIYRVDCNQKDNLFMGNSVYAITPIPLKI